MELEGDLEHWRRAGSISAQALQYGVSLIRPGVKAVDVLDKVEQKIFELGGEIAFPAQLSCNHIAAHWCADKDDPLVLNDQVICLDVGAHVNGCIGDNAATVDLSGKYEKLVKASRDALDNAIKTLKPGVTLGHIGHVINQTIQSHGFTPIHNLSGHGLALYNIHCKPSIPNYDTGEETKLEKGMVIAIEPFATDGAGMIYETDRANIFAFVQSRPVRSPFARDLLKEIKKYNGLPFTTRWLIRKMHPAQVNFGLKELLAAGAITQFPPLPDKDKGMVSQAEHSILIDDKIEVLTKID